LGGINPLERMYKTSCISSCLSLQQEKTERRTGVDALMLLHMRKLLKRLVAEVALIFADVAVNKRVLCQLL